MSNKVSFTSNNNFSNNSRIYIESFSDYVLKAERRRCDENVRGVERIRKSNLPTIHDCYTACKEANHFTYHIRGRNHAICDDQGCFCACWKGPCPLKDSPKADLYEIKS